MIYQAIGLTVKVEKHLKNANWHAAAYYMAALLQRDFHKSKPEEGSAVMDLVDQLKAEGFRFQLIKSTGDHRVIKPSGKFYSGKEALQSWLDAFKKGSE